MAAAIDRAADECVAVTEFGEGRFRVFILFALLAFVDIHPVDREVAREEEVLGAGLERAAQRAGFAGFDFDGDGAEARIRHLARHEALPDKPVDAQLAGIEDTRQ